MIPKLRKSLQKNEKRISPPTFTQHKSSAIEAPKAVIRALYSYSKVSSQELSFEKGDFFHIVGDTHGSDWYNVSNPATGAQGLVPAEYFQVLGRNLNESVEIRKSSRTSLRESTSDVSSTNSPQHNNRPSKTSPLYGIVQYDFQAERPDELDAKAGEAIIIIAQSNHEWFVAKPIGRLGGPGLIPVSFVEIRDMSTGQPITDVEEVAAKAAVPKVEEWKKAAADYKNSSIPLGKFDFNKSTTVPARESPSVQSNPSASGDVSRTDERGLWVVNASVDQYLLDGTRYWFLVRAEMNDGRHRNLCRYYEDFYEFQIALLDKFPVEAGRTNEQRMLPFMPGPLTAVDDAISAQRRADLSVYVGELCRLPDYIVRSELVQNLFLAREGDVESSHPTSMMPQPHSTTFRSRNSGASQVTDSRDRRTSVQRSIRGDGHNSQQSSAGKYASDEVLTTSAPKVPPAIVKIKVFYDEDLIAMRISNDIKYDELCAKLRERLDDQWQIISVKDESRGVYRQLQDDASLQTLLTTVDKVVLYVQ